ncbi:TolC family protein [Roseivirga sp. E12]|uniref:TolC family protein n=1 Tax=Roseivirga sp. E12 TaxID=2819237 RepID=UPI001ABD02B5|nr:TolC family protein [Roseivirga sp. E12]MBO3698423.1 TolC family protein [Roseivirga sp. E12]
MKFRQKLYFGLVLLFMGNLAFGQDSKTEWTLEECVSYAWENNLTIRNNQLTQLQNEIAVKQSKFARLPNLSAGGSVGKSFGRTIDPVSNSFLSQDILTSGLSASSNVTLYQGGILLNTIKQNELNLQASEFDLQKAKNDIGLTVATNFLNVLLNREQLENAKFQLEVTKNQLERTKKLVAAGSLPLTNELDLESQNASNEVQVVNAENNLNLAMLNLKQSMQMPADETLNIVAPELAVDDVAMSLETPSNVYEVAVENQPEVKSADLGIKSNDLAEKIARGAFLPSLSVSGSISTNYSDRARQLQGSQLVNIPARDIGFVQGTGDRVFVDASQETVPVFSDSYSTIDQFNDNLGQSVRVNLSVPIFSRLSNTSNLQRAKINKQRAEITAQNVKNQLRQSIETAYNNALASLKSYEATGKRVTALEESFRATEQRYNVGDVNFVDYQVASNNLFAARTDLVRAKYEYIFRVKILDFYLGNPITLD